VQDEPPPPRPCRLVIADDNPDSADSLSLLMQMEGHEVTVVSDGISALSAIQTGHPDVALLDIGLPGVDGYEVARRVRQQHLVTITLIAVTGWGQAADKAKATEAGFDYHFTKPVEPEEIARLLNALWGNRLTTG
jgi:CheY-like chemotaxis protein